jgi:uncharacterized membrane protein YkoI
MQLTHLPPVRLLKPLRRRIGRIGLALLCACTLALGSGLAHADSDHNRARQALQAGEVLPLATILARVEREYPGKVLDVELDRDNTEGVPRWVYKVKVLTPTGTRIKLQLDAKSGELITAKRKH